MNVHDSLDKLFLNPPASPTSWKAWYKEEMSHFWHTHSREGFWSALYASITLMMVINAYNFNISGNVDAATATLMSAFFFALSCFFMQRFWKLSRMFHAVVMGKVRKVIIEETR
jgi:hypothetical protein